jgi:hypothetical protein
MGYPRLTTTSSLDRLFIQFLKNLRTADTAALRHYRTFDLLFESGRPTGGVGLLIGISSRYPKMDELPPKIVGIMAKQESVGFAVRRRPIKV